MTRTSSTLLVFATAVLGAAQLNAQRPRTAEAAVKAFEAVADRPEGERRRAVRDLGAFADAAVTAVLLKELVAAKEAGYRQEVVRAIGQKARTGCVGPLRDALLAATNPRLRDSAAEAIGTQGDEGVKALGELLAAPDEPRGLRYAVLNGLGRAGPGAARALLVQAAQNGTPRHRAAALRELRPVTGDAAVDQVRVQAVGDADLLLAAEGLGQLARHEHAETMALAVQLHRRTNDTAPVEVQTELLRGLLAKPENEMHFQALLQRAGLAQEPFAAELEKQWRSALQQPAFTPFLVREGVRRTKPGERAAAAHLLGLRGGEGAAGALTTLLHDKDAAVSAAAAEGLGRIGGAAGQKALQALAGAGDARAVPALLALHTLRANDAEWPKELLRHAAQRDVLVRTAALRLLARLRTEAALPAGIDSLAHASWSVRAAAIELLRALRLAGGVPALIARLDKEDSRLRADLFDALEDLTGQHFPGQQMWDKWWQQEGKDFQVAAPKAAGKRTSEPTTVNYFNLPVVSERIVFVLDTSGSMNQPMGTGGITRLDEAVRQLGRVLERLPAKTRFNVVTFGGKAVAVHEKLVPLDGKTRAATMAALGELTAATATNVHDGLLLAFRDPEVDTIYLLTDGQPSAGPIVDPVALAAAVVAWNLSRSVRIHTVSVGTKSSLLEQLAADSGGENVVAR